jgi:hypothetical protein
MAVSAFITDDGYTETAYIEERTGIHPAVRIKYRPTPVTDRTQVIDAMRLVTSKNRTRENEMLADAIVAKLASWDFLNDDGSSMDGVPEPSRANVLKLKPTLYDRLASIVFYGVDGGDTDPQDGTTQDAPADRLEADQKN